VVAEEIPLRYREIQFTIEGHIEDHKPIAVICTGQGGGTGLALERVAINIASARMPYNCGKAPMDETLNPDGPVGYFTTLPYRDLLDLLKEANVPSRLSNSAGTYGCNQIFYHLMDYVAREGLDLPSGFIHVPSMPEQVVNRWGGASMSIELTAKGLGVIVNELARRAVSA
jgi:pyroglutamyl-peptidase